jgi:hypothetical protein
VSEVHGPHGVTCTVQCSVMEPKLFVSVPEPAPTTDSSHEQNFFVLRYHIYFGKFLDLVINI